METTNERLKQLNAEPEMDYCIYCNELTPYSKNLNIDLRLNYIEGAGQLCNRCYKEIYG